MANKNHQSSWYSLVWTRYASHMMEYRVTASDVAQSDHCSTNIKNMAEKCHRPQTNSTTSAQ